MSFHSKIYCKGLLCDKWNRKNQCSSCHCYLCKSCVIYCQLDNKKYCPNCYVASFINIFDRLPDNDKKKIEEMEIQTNKNNVGIEND